MKMKRILAGVLSAAMVLTCAPVSVLAAGRGELKVVDDTVNEANEEAAAAENPVAAVSAAVDSATADSAASEEAAAEPYTVDAEETVSPATATPSEDGSSITYSNIDLTDAASYTVDASANSDFYNGLSSIDITMVYKVNTVSSTEQTLFSLQGPGEQFITFYQIPSTGKIGWRQKLAGANKSTAGFSKSLKADDSAYHKISVQFYNNNGSGYTRVVYDGATVSGFDSNGWYGAGYCHAISPLVDSSNANAWNLSKILFGKKTSNADGVNFLDFSGDIRYVKVSKTAYADYDALKSAHTAVDASLLSSFNTAKTTAQQKVDAGAEQYTESSFQDLNTALTEANSTDTTKDWKISTSLAKLEDALAGLVSRDTLSASLSASISDADALVSLGETAFVSGYPELSTALESAKSLNTSSATFDSLQNAITALNTAIEAVVFVDKIYAGADVGTDVYSSDDSLFYSHMNGLACTVVFKYNETDYTKLMPLLTLSNDDGKYFTVYYQGCISGNNNVKNGFVAFGYNGSGATGFTVNKINNTTSSDGIALINDNNYHKLTIAIENGKIHVALDGNPNVASAYDSIYNTNLNATTQRWFGDAVDSLKATAWNHVTIGQKSSNEEFQNSTSTTYEDSLAVADIKYVQVCNKACSAEEAKAKNIDSALVKDACTSASNLCTSLLTEENYTAGTWSTYSIAKTAFDAAATEGAKWDAIAPLETAVYGLERLYTVTATAGTVSGSSVAADSSKFEFLQEATVTAPETNEEGQTFACWKMSVNGSEAQTVCYNHSYTFYVIDSVTMTPCYAAAETPVEEAFTVLCNASFNPGTGKMTFTSKRSIPEGYTIVGHGIIITDNEADKDTLDLNTTGKKTARATTTGLLGTYKATLSCKTSATWYGRAYVTYADSQGNEATVYSDIVPCNVTVK